MSFFEKALIGIALLVFIVSVAAVEISDIFIATAMLSMLSMYGIAYKNGYAD